VKAKVRMEPPSESLCKPVSRHQRHSFQRPTAEYRIGCKSGDAPQAARSRAQPVPQSRTSIGEAPQSDSGSHLHRSDGRTFHTAKFRYVESAASRRQAGIKARTSVEAAVMCAAIPRLPTSKHRPSAPPLVHDTGDLNTAAGTPSNDPPSFSRKIIAHSEIHLLVPARNFNVTLAAALMPSKGSGRCARTCPGAYDQIGFVIRQKCWTPALA